MKYKVPNPPNEIFEKKNVRKMPERIIEEIDTSQPKGIFTYIKGEPFPYPGYPHPEPLRTIAGIKRIVMATIKYFPFLFLFRKRFKKWFKFISKRMLSRCLLKPNRYCRSGRELYRVIRDKDIANAVCMIWEYDNAYRFMGQDILGELDKSNLSKHPKKELLRLIDLAIKRKRGNFSKIRALRKVIKFIPTFFLREAIETLEKVDINEVELKDSDFYWCLERNDYKHKNYSYKQKQWIKKNKSYNILR